MHAMQLKHVLANFAWTLMRLTPNNQYKVLSSKGDSSTSPIQPIAARSSSLSSKTWMALGMENSRCRLLISIGQVLISLK